MLGSEHEGERSSAALQAEAFRKRHGLTWEGDAGVTAGQDRAQNRRSPGTPTSPRKRSPFGAHHNPKSIRSSPPAMTR